MTPTRLDVFENAAFAGDQRLECVARGVEDAFQVHIEEQVPFGNRWFSWTGLEGEAMPALL